ncbi:MAG: hypothetical protein PHQ59_03780 [Candidatus Daviesbacteria bacterium]|nr:hypothetical protein [Candidatus Daviesbacteria bacterium]
MKFIKYLLVFFLLIFINSVSLKPAKAIVDPLLAQNNKFGIHMISPIADESSPAATLVNSSGGDWGYVTILIESKDRDTNKWQSFFDDLRRKHLIPIIRLATCPEKDYWLRPYDGEETAWADFLDTLNWPTKNRYIVVYNEPNQGQEWGGNVDPKSYARILDKTITALKNKNPDFFVINAGFDASAPQQTPKYMDEEVFLTQMEEEVPGILNRLDGWSTHSYPNPGFTASPDSAGRISVRTWIWETLLLQRFGVTKNIPVFITETGWKHAEGVDYDKSLPSADKVGNYYKTAFENAWNSNRIVAVSPFLLDYQGTPFDHFSFKRISGDTKNLNVLGATTDTANKTDLSYYSPYTQLKEMPKTSGKPVQDNRAELVKGEIYTSLISGETYNISLTFKNTGQSIWNDGNEVELKATKGGNELQIESIKLKSDQKVEPGQTGTFSVKLKTPISGTYLIALQLFNNGKEFDQAPFIFSTTIKSPVQLILQTALQWKNDPTGDYILTISSDSVENSSGVKINSNGTSSKIPARYLLPDYTFQFTLNKPFYKPKTVTTKVVPGDNVLNFGTLEPDFFSALLTPINLWELLPFFN